MANTKQAIGNVLDTVIGVSNTITDTVNMVGKSARYGNKWMDAVLAKQTITLAIDADLFNTHYIQRKAEELAIERKRISTWAAESPENEKLYADALAQLTAVLASVKK